MGGATLDAADDGKGRVGSQGASALEPLASLVPNAVSCAGACGADSRRPTSAAHWAERRRRSACAS